MIVYINGRFLGRRITGVDRYAIEVLKELNTLIAENHPSVAGVEYKIVIPPRIKTDLHLTHIPIVAYGFFSGHAWEQLSLLMLSLSSKSMVLNLCNTGSIFVRSQIVVIHDAAVVRIPSTFSLAFRVWYKTLMPVLGRVAKKIVTVSEYSKKDIINFFGVHPEKVQVVGAGGEHILSQQPDAGILEKFQVHPGSYVLAVSSHAPHKNFSLTIESLKLSKNANIPYLIAGGANQKIFGENSQLDSSKVTLLGYVSDNELRALYEHALCFVFPSLYEGFGLPPLEAMNCGCPVLASNAASIPEVCSDAALYFSPHDPQELSKLIDNVAHDADLRKSLVNQGLKRAKDFSWKNSAIDIARMCKEIFTIK